MNNILIDFNLLIDTDYGLIKLIKTEYYENEFIDILLTKMRDKIILGELVSRKDKNPLYIALKKDYKDSADSLYKEFIESEYDSILKYSISTSLLELILTYIETNSCTVTVICKNKSEEQIINKYKLKSIISDNYANIDVSEFDSIYIKDYREVLQFKALKAKNIFIGNYRFNLEEDNYTPIKDVSLLVADINIISVIDVYNSNKYIISEG